MTLAEKETTLKELEAGLWETADSLRNESSLTSQMYYMPVLGIIFLRHATYRFRMVEKALLDDPEWPKYKGVPRPVEPDDFETKSAMFVPEKARYDYLLNLPGDQDICKAVNDAMTLIESAKPILKGILPKTYSSLNPGAYVGVPPHEDDGVDFTSRMKEIHAELLTRQKELGAIMKSIDGNLRGLGL